MIWNPIYYSFYILYLLTKIGIWPIVVPNKYVLVLKNIWYVLVFKNSLVNLFK